MVDTIKLALKDNLQYLDWMSDVSHVAAETKLDQMINLVGYPDYILNTTWADILYSDLAITEGTTTLIVILVYWGVGNMFLNSNPKEIYLVR